jgi:hypothetical protein
MTAPVARRVAFVSAGVTALLVTWVTSIAPASPVAALSNSHSLENCP